MPRFRSVGVAQFISICNHVTTTFSFKDEERKEEEETEEKDTGFGKKSSKHF